MFVERSDGDTGTRANKKKDGMEGVRRGCLLREGHLGTMYYHMRVVTKELAWFLAKPIYFQTSTFDVRPRLGRKKVHGATGKGWRNRSWGSALVFLLHFPCVVAMCIGMQRAFSGISDFWRAGLSLGGEERIGKNPGSSPRVDVMGPDQTQRQLSMLDVNKEDGIDEGEDASAGADRKISRVAVRQEAAASLGLGDEQLGEDFKGFNPRGCKWREKGKGEAGDSRRVLAGARGRSSRAGVFFDGRQAEVQAPSSEEGVSSSKRKRESALQTEDKGRSNVHPPRAGALDL
ncbi:hypothetical protein FA13DRAFT_1710865 [Coprinellus micaceus]|uniref:Uncharacterized protein n=1 Tax=Coprinellus micaceus TaxID=71717 RepID=A0A4Y7T604_COPMI|nr:hypothetical protein FA13DRAFT_1710865 [Coprinellus micaceus]